MVNIIFERKEKEKEKKKGRKQPEMKNIFIIQRAIPSLFNATR